MLNFKQIRNDKNLTQVEFADKIGISARALSNYENGNIDISLKKLQEIASVMEIDFFDLFLIKPVQKISIAKDVISENSKVEIVQQKTITILEREVEDLREDKYFLKNVIDKKLGKEKSA
jgi:transcriptional regulator with XRE-family HTH domain